MSEEDTVRAPDQVDGQMEGDALIHTGSEAPAADPHAGEVVVDQAMLDENPALAEAGVEIGAVGTEATPEQAAELDAKLEEEKANE